MSPKLKSCVYLISMPVSFLYILCILVELSWNKKQASNLLKLKKLNIFLQFKHISVQQNQDEIKSIYDFV